ncbi:hypothetical protein F4802DRAFT_561645 [Xylaria palmicola]|nr:hypothetical protein F4802DRAFT_561645 [Xylaria palmicola]
MSQKITSKNLTYDNSLPPFLARLRGQQAAHSGPDPILAAHRRPGQKRSASEDAEDAPVVVDEAGNVVHLEDGQLGVGDGSSSSTGSGAARQGKGEAGEGGNHPGPDEDGEENEGEGDKKKEVEREREKVAGIGAQRKRKVGRVVGEERSDDKGNRDGEEEKEARIAKASADVRRLVGRDADAQGPADSRKSAKHRGPQRDGQQQQQSSVKATKKKPAKKIKLSFGDDDGE